MKCIALTSIIVLGLAGTLSGSAAAQDPSNNRLYRGTAWVPKVYPKIDQAVRVAPRFTPAPYRPYVRTFGAGWSVGKAIERRYDLGGKVYQRFMAPPSTGNSRRR